MESESSDIMVCRTPGHATCTVALWIWRVVPLVQLTLGTCGNVFSIVILLRRRLRRYSTTVYLLFLAGADLVALWSFNLKKTLQVNADVHVDAMSQFFCKSYNWVVQTAASFSVWLLVLLTFERVVYTLLPTNARTKMTKKFTTIASLITLFFICAFYTHYIVGYEIRYVSNTINDTSVGESKACVEVSKFYRSNLEMYFGPVGVIAFVGVPIILLLVGNLTIAATIIKQARKVRPNLPNRSTAMNNRSIKTTRMLFMLCGFFMLCTLPHGIFGLVYLSGSRTWTDSQFAAAHLVFAVTANLMMSNFTFNFLLYASGGCIFKQELVSVTTGFVNAVRRFFKGSNEEQSNRTQVVAINERF